MNHNPVCEQPSPPKSKFIFLIGMPGAGKSYWGEKVASAYDLQFVDLDRFIAKKENASVPALFASYGENGFREREQKWLKHLLNHTTDTTIVACGGGTPCFSGNMDLLLNVGCVVYLNAEISELVANLNQSTEIRPLLRGRGDMAAYLAKLLQQRKKVYEMATHILHINLISLTNFEQIIHSCTNQH